MAQTKQREVDLATADGGLAAAELPKVVGSITITFHDAGGHIVPTVSFAPLGRINPSTIERYLPFVYQEIQKQQVLERRVTADPDLEWSDK